MAMAMTTSAAQDRHRTHARRQRPANGRLLCLIAAPFLFNILSEPTAVAALSSSQNKPPPPTFLYFAFGSNMCSQTMSDIRNLKPLASTAAVLPRHVLRFNLPGMPLVEPSWASVEPVEEDNVDIDDATSNAVHGVLYKLTEEDFVSVCNTEGVPFGYTLHRCRSIIYDGNGKDEGEKALSDPEANRVFCYTLRAANKVYRKKSKHIAPSRSYMNVLIRGANEYGLDASYLKMLEAIPTGQTIGDGVAERMLDAAIASKKKRRRR